ncbi:hypothetical protein ACSVC9_02550 [Clostridium sp. LBM24168]
MKKRFQITLAMMDPKPDITIDFTTEDLTNDILNARDNFNIYHKGKQKLEIINISKAMINVELEIEVEDGEEIELYRKVGLFSRRLHNKFGWEQYSNTPNRLLTIVSSREVDLSSDISISEVRGETEATQSLKTGAILDMKKEKLRYLYAQKRYVELQIQELEQQGVSIE